ncbi:MAG: hypothetical protein RLZZ324_919 [Candidatus Parcubacteria bacterium]|jgi:hypothetical protein
MNDMRQGNREDNRGLIAILTVVLIGALILAIGISSSLIGRTEIVQSGDFDREQATREVVASCVDEALHRLKLNSGYVGGTVPIGSNSCTVAVSGSGSTRTITANATIVIVNSYTKRVTVTASKRSNVANSASGWGIDTWTEGDPP